MLPALVNQFIGNVKDSSLVYFLGLLASEREIFRVGQDQAAFGQFDPARIGSGRGTRSMQTRAGELHGDIRWQAGTLGGTKVRLRFPLPDVAPASTGYPADTATESMPR